MLQMLEKEITGAIFMQCIDIQRKTINMKTYNNDLQKPTKYSIYWDANNL